MSDPRGPNPHGWLSPRGQAILFVIITAIISGFACSVITAVLMTRQMETKAPVLTTGFHPEKGEELLTPDGKHFDPPIKYDADLEESSVEFTRTDSFTATHGKAFVYIKTNRNLTEESQKRIRADLERFNIITRIFTSPRGIAVEKVSSRNEDMRPHEKVLDPWDEIFDHMKYLVSSAEFEPKFKPR